MPPPPPYSKCTNCWSKQGPTSHFKRKCAGVKILCNISPTYLDGFSQTIFVKATQVTVTGGLYFANILNIVEFLFVVLIFLSIRRQFQGRSLEFFHVFNENVQWLSPSPPRTLFYFTGLTSYGYIFLSGRRLTQTNNCNMGLCSSVSNGVEKSQ